MAVVSGLALLVACGGGGSSEGKLLSASFSRLDGTQASISDYQGRPVVVNFFASTCIPCQTEMPAFEKVHQEVGPGVAFLGMDVQDSVESGRAFVEAVKVTWDIGRDPDASILQEKVGGIGLPTTVILDRSSRIVFTHLGALDATTLRSELQSRGFT